MPPLTAIERFFERLFERPSARLFHARIQPVQLQRRIERAMEGERLTTSDRTLVPNRFVVHLHPTDLAEFGDMTGTLASELADGALSFARAHHYTVVDRPRVDLLADPSSNGPDIRVDVACGCRTWSRGGDPSHWPTGRPGDRGRRPDRDARSCIPKPAAPRPSCTSRPDGRTRDVVVPPEGVTIGRATDNDLVAVDGRVPRHHGRIIGRRGTLFIRPEHERPRVNGVPVSEVVLGVGDRLEVGDTALVIEFAGAPD
jgi:hypothetical protein